jgi:branched-chain amino acid transport system substrate-binding protein
MLISHSFGLPHLSKYEMHFSAVPLGSEPNKTFPAKLYDALASTGAQPKTVAIVTNKFPSTLFFSTGARDLAARRGLNVVLYLEYEFGTRDSPVFLPIAKRVKEANPDFVWVGAVGQDGNLFLDAMKKLDYAPRGHFYLFPAPGPLLKAPQGTLAFSFTMFEEHPPFTDDPVTAELVGLYWERATKAGVPYPRLDNQAASSFAAWQVLEAALTATESLDGKALAKWLKANKVDTIVGKMRFDGPNNYGDDLSKVKQIQDGRWVVVWPKEWAAPGAKLLIPGP